MSSRFVTKWKWVEKDGKKYRIIRMRLAIRGFEDAEAECARILAEPHDDPKTGRRIVMALPAYDQCIKASHVFNLLDARGVISVTERAAYIGRVRALARGCCEAWIDAGRVVGNG